MCDYIIISQMHYRLDQVDDCEDGKGDEDGDDSHDEIITHILIKHYSEILAMLWLCNDSVFINWHVCWKRLCKRKINRLIVIETLLDSAFYAVGKTDSVRARSSE